MKTEMRRDFIFIFIFVFLSEGCVRKLTIHKSMKKPCPTGSGTGRVVKKGLGKGDTGTEIRERPKVCLRVGDECVNNR